MRDLRLGPPARYTIPRLSQAGVSEKYSCAPLNSFGPVWSSLPTPRRWAISLISMINELPDGQSRGIRSCYGLAAFCFFALVLGWTALRVVLLLEFRPPALSLREIALA